MDLSSILSLIEPETGLRRFFQMGFNTSLNAQYFYKSSPHKKKETPLTQEKYIPDYRLEEFSK